LLKTSTGFALIKRKDLWMAQVLMYTTAVCPYCQRAEALLKQRGVSHIEKIRIDLDPAARDAMMSRTGRRTVPQIYIGEQHVGGFDDLAALDRDGGLTPLLTKE
jgi:glutaredoxin 3